MGTRRQARVIAFQTLYRYDCTEESLERLLDFSWLSDDTDEQAQQPEPSPSGDRPRDKKSPAGSRGARRLSRSADESLEFATLLITGTMENLGSIDSAIKNQLEHWDFKRLARVDLAILRISVYCLLYQKSIPATVTIDEAIDIAKEFGSDDSYRFVNGVLDGIRKSRESVSAT